MTEYDLIVIGGGPAGMASALSAHRKGVEKILIIERDRELGGILNQCIHSGFGLDTFQEELTGPEYAHRFIKKVFDEKIEYMPNTMVINLDSEEGTVSATVRNISHGEKIITAHAAVLAMGCREKPRGALNIPGSRPAGIFSAGTAQRYVNIEGKLPGNKIVILGSGDIGLIMARRLSLEGAKVECVAEIAPYSGGLRRNIVQCLFDYDIPLLLSHTVTNIHGRKRITGVTIQKVDENFKPINDTDKYYECDTLLLSVGLIPENELTAKTGAEMDPVTRGPKVNDKLMTTVQGVFACGNVLHVHDLVDNVTKEALKAGEYAADYVLYDEYEKKIPWGDAVRPPIPQKEKNTVPEDMDITHQVICVRCPNGCLITADDNMNISGNKCKRGEEYIINELTKPRRSISSTVSNSDPDHPRLPCKTKGDIPKDKIFDVMKEIIHLRHNGKAQPGDLLIENTADTGVDIVATGEV